MLRRVLGINVMYRIKNGDIRENKETECMEACGLNHFKIVSAYEKMELFICFDIYMFL